MTERKRKKSSTDILFGAKRVVKPAEFSKKTTFLCHFCGGKNCKKELANKNPHKNAINGLHSDWITDNILASCRPNKNDI